MNRMKGRRVLLFCHERRDHFHFVLLWIFLATFVWHASAAPVPQLAQSTLINAIGAANDFFGQAVAAGASGLVVVGAPNQDVQRGAAYTFNCSPGANNCSAGMQLLAADGAQADQYGYAVAAAQTTVVIGARMHGNKGAIYVYECPTASSCGTPAQPIPTDLANTDLFGTSVAINEAATAIAAGSPLKTVSAHISQGAAYVFQCPSGPSSCAQAVELLASDGAAFDGFGSSVALSGTIVIVGAPSKDNNTGAAYAFFCTSQFTSCSTSIPLPHPDSVPGDSFGQTVAISGTTATVGAVGRSNGTGGVYVFDCSSRTACVLTMQLNTTAIADISGPTFAPTVNAHFGSVLAMSGALLIVGAVGANNQQGQAFVFLCSSTALVCNYTAVLTSPAFTGLASPADAQLGQSVAVLNATIVVGSPGQTVDGHTQQGDAYTFTCDPVTGDCDCQPRFNAPQCTSCVHGFAAPQCTQCLPGFEPPLCDSCSQHFGGPDCLSLLCPDGEYLVMPGDCQPCNSSCADCIGTASTCTSCNLSSPFSLLENSTCVANCSPSLPIVFNGTCLAMCPPSYPYIFNGTCVMTCPPIAPFDFAGTCAAMCDAPQPYYLGSQCVASCSASSSAFPFLLNDTCVSRCTDPLPFVVNNSVCVETCSDASRETPYDFATNASCVAACVAPLPYMLNFTCVDNCSPSTQPFLQNYTCVRACDIAITPYVQNFVCVDDCTSPEPNLEGSHCVATCNATGNTPYLQNRTCVPQCTEPTPFLNNSAFCVADCTPLVLFNNSLCLSTCAGGPLPFNDNGTCVVKCAGSLPLVQDGVCVAECDSSTPFISVNSTCLACTFASVDVFNENGTCVETCSPYKPYADPQNICVASCADAIGAPYLQGNFCVAACTVNGSTPFLQSNVCVSACTLPEPYLDIDTCVASCTTAPGRPYTQGSDCVSACSSGTPYLSGTNCTASCQAPLPFINLETSTCVAICPVDIPYVQNSTCVNACTPTGPTPLLFNNSDCVASCPGEFPLIEESICVHSCSSAYPFNQNSTCVSSCIPPLAYSDDQVCVSVCEGQRQYYQGTVCVSACNSTQYADSGHVCLSCQLPCSSCNGSATTCIACDQNSPMPYLAGSTCTNQCNTTILPYLQDMTCVADCSSSTPFVQDGTCVANCTGMTSYFGNNFTCVAACAMNEYAQPTTRFCLPCSSPCVSCYGMASNCTSCAAASTAPYLQLGTCVASCSGSTPYLDPTSHTCIESCASLVDTPFVLHGKCAASCDPTDPYVQSGTCVSVCASDRFLNATMAACEPCATTCNTCNGSTTTDCTSCSTINGSAYFLSPSGACVMGAQCPAGRFANLADHQCDPCYDSVGCNVCLSGAQGACTVCGANLFLLNGVCYVTCPDHTYPSPLLHTCKTCDSSCGNCIGPDSTQCTSCGSSPGPSGLLFLDPTSGQCVSASLCPNGTYADSLNQTCTACNPSCATCTGNATLCTSCSVAEPLLFGNSCVQSCPLGTRATVNGSYCDTIGATTMYLYAPTIISNAYVEAVILQIYTISPSIRRGAGTLLVELTMEQCSSSPLFVTDVAETHLMTGGVSLGEGAIEAATLRGFSVVVHYANNETETIWANCTTGALFMGVDSYAFANAIILTADSAGACAAADLDAAFNFTLPHSGFTLTSCGYPKNLTTTPCDAYDDPVAHVAWARADISPDPILGNCSDGFVGAPTQLCTARGWLPDPNNTQTHCVACPEGCVVCTLSDQSYNNNNSILCALCASGYNLTEGSLCQPLSETGSGSEELLSVSATYGLVIVGGVLWLIAEAIYLAVYADQRRASVESIRWAYWTTAFLALPLAFVAMIDLASDAYFVIVAKSTSTQLGSEAYFIASLVFVLVPYAASLTVAFIGSTRASSLSLSKVLELPDAEGRTAEAVRRAWNWALVFSAFSGQFYASLQLALAIGTNPSIEDEFAVEEAHKTALETVTGLSPVWAAVSLVACQILSRDIPHLVLQALLLQERGADPALILAITATATSTVLTLSLLGAFVWARNRPSMIVQSFSVDSSTLAMPGDHETTKRFSTLGSSTRQRQSTTSSSVVVLGNGTYDLYALTDKAASEAMQMHILDDISRSSDAGSTHASDGDAHPPNTTGRRKRAAPPSAVAVSSSSAVLTF